MQHSPCDTSVFRFRFGDLGEETSDACGGVIFSPSSWEPQEEGMMNIAARFSLSKKPRFIDPKGNKPND
jgi:hypothetical protein